MGSDMQRGDGELGEAGIQIYETRLITTAATRSTRGVVIAPRQTGETMHVVGAATGATAPAGRAAAVMRLIPSARCGHANGYKPVSASGATGPDHATVRRSA